VKVSMERLGGQAAAGFQAFLEFDPGELQFLNGTYTSSPFGLPLIAPIAANGNHIDLAAGINQFAGQTPTSADAVLAYLTYLSPNGMCQVHSVQFRPHDPPSRLTTLSGGSIVPLQLIGLPPAPMSCYGDVSFDGVVNVNDLLMVINAWGNCPSGSACCPADVTGDNIVNVNDLLAVINSWGSCR
jgi:hypothetical protein